VGAEYYSEEQYQKVIVTLEEALSEYTKIMDKFREEIKKKTNSVNPRLLPDSAIVRISLTGQELKKLKGIWWDYQHIGYPNSLLVLKGFPFFRRLEVLKTKLELLKLKGADESEILKIERQFELTLKEVEKYRKAMPID